MISIKALQTKKAFALDILFGNRQIWLQKEQLMYHKELDISHEVSRSDVIKFADKYNCSCTLLQEYGPAGGNPLYLFSSKSKQNLEDLQNNIIGA